MASSAVVRCIEDTVASAEPQIAAMAAHDSHTETKPAQGRPISASGRWSNETAGGTLSLM